MREKRKVFISHSSLDKEKIDKLASSLKSLGCDIFYSSEITTNNIKFGTYEGGIYGQIKKEISESDIILFMVSENFYSSIPSMVEIGISYALDKEMIPITFKSGNYKEDLKAIFNYNQLLPSLDNDEDVIKLLTQISNSANPVEIFKYQKEIVEDIKLKNIVEYEKIEELEDICLDTKGTIVEYNNIINSDIANELATTDNVITEDVLSAVNKINRLSSFDYLFIKYICEERVNEFYISENSLHWSKDFKIWIDRENICIVDSDSYNEKFLRLLYRHNLLYKDIFKYSINQLGIEVVEFIYDRDKDKIDEIINKYYYIPF